MDTKVRRKPLTIREYEADYRQRASDLQLVERVFYGGMDSNQLRAALWPLIFGLVRERGRFIRKTPSMTSISGQSSCSSTTTATTGYHSHGLTSGHHQHHHKHNHFSKTSSQTSADSTMHRQHHPGLTLSTSSPAFLPTGLNRRRVIGAGAGAAMSARSGASDTKYVYIEHEDNLRKWRDLERQYRSYESQWKSIQPEQELRFSVFRERKALIERDVIRSDRSHPFYADNSNHLKGLTTLLMTYMMYDFDIGYLQGMSDIAAPILYVYQGEPVKSFWVFVEVMKLLRRNFEHSQKTIHFQLNCLYRLVKLTDPKLAKHLRENDCSNCFFVFRCIVCQFKRELMKDTSKPATSRSEVHRNSGGGLSDGLASPSTTSSTTSSSASSSSSSSVSSMSDEDEATPDDGTLIDSTRQVEENYNRVLNLWDTIWCVQRRHELLARRQCIHTFTIANGKTTSRKQALSRDGQRTSTKSTSTTAPINIAHGNQPHQCSTKPSPLSTHSSNGYNSALNCSSKNGMAQVKTVTTSNRINDDKACQNHINDSKARQRQGTNQQRASGQSMSRSYSYQNNISNSQRNGTAAAAATTTTTTTTSTLAYHQKQKQIISHRPVPTSPVSSTKGHLATTTSASDGSTTLSLLRRSGQLNGSSRRLSGGHSENTVPLPRAGRPMRRRQSNTSLCSNGSLASSHDSNNCPAGGSTCSCCCSPKRRGGDMAPVKQEQIVYTKETFYSSFDPNQADVPRFELTETEKFVLALCLSLIRRERKHILINQMEASEIHQHFINPALAYEFYAFMEQAYKAYDYLNTDCDLKQLVRGANELAGEAATSSNMSSPVCADEHLPETADTYELLKDYLIISPTAYNISMTSLNNLSQKGSSPNGGNSALTTTIRRDSSGRFGVSQKSWDHFLNSEVLQ